jgi:hypothetical protein
VHRGVGPLGIPAVALVTLVLAGGAARAQDGAAEAGRAFDEAYAAFGEAYRQGDPAAVTALYWHDAYYLCAWRIHADGFSEVGSPDGAER